MSTVLIAESESLSRHALRQLLEAEGQTIVAEATDGLQAVRLAIDKSPDLLVVALRLDGLSGLEVVKRLRARKCPAKILVVSSQDDNHSIGLCIAAGANGFVSKLDDIADFKLAVDAVKRGRMYFPVTGEEQAGAHDDEASQLARLSDRERSVLMYLARGYRLTKIAQLLVVSESTVSTYKTRLLRKLNAASVVELADIARRNHLTGDAEADGKKRRKPSWMTDESSVVSNLLDAIPSAVSIRDTRGSILFANAYMREQLGSLFDQMAKRGSESLERVLGMSERQATELENAFEQSSKTGKPFTKEYALMLNGHPRSAVIWSTPLLDDQGQVLAMVSGSQDITSIDLTIAELRQSREELGRLARLRRLLLEDLERDLTEPLRDALNSIASARSARAEGAVLEQCLANTESALRSLERRLASMQVLVEDAVESARPLRDRCNLNALFDAATAPVVAAANRDARPITLQFVGPEDLCIWADPVRIRHVIFAEIDIAYRASADGPITVRLVADRTTRALAEVSLDILAPTTHTLLEMFAPELARLNDILGAWNGSLQYDNDAGHTHVSSIALLQTAEP